MGTSIFFSSPGVSRTRAALEVLACPWIATATQFLAVPEFVELWVSWKSRLDRRAQIVGVLEIGRRYSCRCLLDWPGLPSSVSERRKPVQS